MAKISPVSIKYMIRAKFAAEGPLEKPDVIGALFGQTEGLLGSDLEMRDLQKEGKIGRIEVELERVGGKTEGRIEIPTALDQSETTLIAAAIETIERIGPTDARIEVEGIDDVRGVKREFIVDRAKQLLERMQGGTSSREISEDVKLSTRTMKIKEYGDEKLPAGDISGEEIIVVEGRADVVNLLRNGVYNVIGMNGTKLPKAIAELSTKKILTLFVDGDRGGRLIAQNVVDNAEVKYIAVAPDGKEVEELSGKEILIALRRKMLLSETSFRKRSYSAQEDDSEKESAEEISIRKLTSGEKDRLTHLGKSISGSGKALVVNESLDVINESPARSATSIIKRSDSPFAVIVDGTVTKPILEVAREFGCQAVVAKVFSSTDTDLNLLSF
jgi:DNA primase